MEADMKSAQNQTCLYSILDPTGNITALAEGSVEKRGQSLVAEKIMKNHPEVEQVGFIRFAETPREPVQVYLRMAGGEFCGNASMCAAALYAEKKSSAFGKEQQVILKVSGSEEPVEVQLTKEASGIYRAGVKMPPVRDISFCPFSYQELSGSLPIVRLEGISHVIIEEDSPFFSLKETPFAAQEAIKKWCRELAAEGLGLMFLSGNAPEFSLTPLVYIPGSNTIFWENSCGSGSCACGVYEGEKRGAPFRLFLKQPGGTLSVNYVSKSELWIFGTVKKRSELILSV